MAWLVRLVLASLCAGAMTVAVGQTAAKPAASAARAPAPAASPIASSLRAQKVAVDKDGKESLEDASNMSIGEVVQYQVQHRNVSRRRLLQIDFGIPIPPGTSYVEGSATPEGATRVKLDKRRDQMQWRVEKLDPGDTVSMSLRVKIDPDPTLTPTPAAPKRPEFRRQ